MLNWESKKNDDGMSVSEVEPIADSQTKQEIATFLRDKECAGSIEFW